MKMSDVRVSWLSVAFIALGTMTSIYLISQLKFDYDFEDFFPKNDPETEYFLEFRKSFETDNDFFIVALENDGSIFDSTFLSHVDSLTKKLQAIPNVEECVGPTSLMTYAVDPLFGGVFETPLLSANSVQSFKQDSIAIWNSPSYVGVFFASDGRSVAINMKHKQMLSKEKCDELSKNIQDEVNKFQFKKSHVIGRALGQTLYVELMIKELALFISISLVLTTIFLFIAFRSGWGIIIPTTVVLLSIIWTLGFLKIMGKDLDLMLTVLPTILFVVGMSDSVHVLTKYMQELRKGKEKIEAIRYAFKSIRLATFLTALTTAIGFFTLVFSNIQPISDFGIYTAVGVLLAYGLTYTLLPAILILGKPKRMNDFAMSDDFWTSKLHKAFMWVLRKRKSIWISGIVVLALSAWGISAIVVDNKMLEDLKDDHVLKQEFAFMEKEFAGCRPFEMGIILPNDSAIRSLKVLKQLDTLELYLRNEYGVGAMLGYAQLVKESNKTLNFGLEEYYTIPDSTKELNEIANLLQQGPIARATGLAYNDSTRTVRISGKVGDIGRLHFDSCNAKLNAFIDANCPDLSNRKVTGTAHLIDVNNRSLIENTVWDLLISVLVIGIIMGIVYKSWRMIPLTILPNLFPLLIVAGIMGFTGIPLKVSTSIIFNIAFGIAVDDTIHFLARVRSLLGEGLSVNYAVKRTFLTTGKAMIVTTLILSGGFLTLIFSDFLGTHYIGLLVSLTLFIALFAELLFSPLIVMFFYRQVKKG